MKRFFKGLGVFVALIVVGIVSAFAVVALLLYQEEVRVPNLVGQDIVTVIDPVTQLGLQLKVDRREPHPSMARDIVIGQSPAAGTGIKKGRQVRVVVSAGPSDMQAPKLVGENFRKADIMIRQAGFFPGDVSRVSSDVVDRDTVIAQDPQTGSPLNRGGTISLLVSVGKKAPVYVMPKLVGKKAEEAVKVVDRMGLQYRVITRATTSRVQSGDRIVVSQKPGIGTPVANEASVDIVVSR